MVEREHGLPAATASAVAGLVEGDWLHLGQPIRVPQQPALPPARPEARRRRRLQVRRPRDGDILKGTTRCYHYTLGRPLDRDILLNVF